MWWSNQPPVYRPVCELALCFFSLAGCAVPGFGQAPPASAAGLNGSNPPTLHSTTSLVQVPTLVQTATHDTVFSIRAEDFLLTDDGVRQNLILDPDVKAPLAVVVAMQIGGAARGQFANYRGLETMLETLVGGAPNKVAIVQFDSRPEADCEFTSDIAEWKDVLNTPDRGDDGAAVYDGLAYALHLLDQQPPGVRRAVLLISQRRDDGSKARLKDIIRTIAETNTAVYSLNFSVEKAAIKQAFKQKPELNAPLDLPSGPTQGYFNLMAPIQLALGAMQKNLSAELAQLSGGDAAPFSSQVEFDRAINTFSNHIRNNYMLSFYPQSGTPGLHTLRVKVPAHPDWSVTSRANYWLESPLIPGEN